MTATLLKSYLRFAQHLRLTEEVATPVESVAASFPIFDEYHQEAIAHALWVLTDPSCDLSLVSEAELVAEVWDLYWGYTAPLGRVDPAFKRAFLGTTLLWLPYVIENSWGTPWMPGEYEALCSSWLEGDGDND